MVGYCRVPLASMPWELLYPDPRLTATLVERALTVSNSRFRRSNLSPCSCIPLNLSYDSLTFVASFRISCPSESPSHPNPCGRSPCMTSSLHRHPSFPCDASPPWQTTSPFCPSAHAFQQALNLLTWLDHVLEGHVAGSSTAPPSALPRHVGWVARAACMCQAASRQWLTLGQLREAMRQHQLISPWVSHTEPDGGSGCNPSPGQLSGNDPADDPDHYHVSNYPDNALPTFRALPSRPSPALSIPGRVGQLLDNFQSQWNRLHGAIDGCVTFKCEGGGSKVASDDVHLAYLLPDPPDPDSNAMHPRVRTMLCKRLATA